MTLNERNAYEYRREGVLAGFSRSGKKEFLDIRSFCQALLGPYQPGLGRRILLEYWKNSVEWNLISGTIQPLYIARMQFFPLRFSPPHRRLFS
jgi:hypothetical protein